MTPETEPRTVPHLAVATRSERPICRMTLGLTLYLDEPLEWAQRHAGEVLSEFIAQLEPADACWYTTSQLDEWRRLERGMADQLSAGLSSRSILRPRHLLSFQVADDIHVSTLGMSYVEVDESRGGSSTLELTFPQHQRVEDFRAFVLKVLEGRPFRSGVAGYAARWNALDKRVAFTGLHRWCLRYLGMDVQDPEQMCWLAKEGLPGTGWLTFLGTPFLKRLDLESPLLSVRRLSHGICVQAGARPTLGDVNRGEFPTAYAEAVRRLRDLLVKEPPEFWGEFAVQGDTRAWFRRFLEPSEWASR